MRTKIFLLLTFLSTSIFAINPTPILNTDNDGDGYYAEVDDCDDNDASINPSGIDDCYTDRNCDGYIEPCYTDNDGDGYAAQDGDCDDNDYSVNPGAEDDYCNNVDKNCDGYVGIGPHILLWYDGDGDGYGDYSNYNYFSYCWLPSDYVENSDDCNDSDASVNPGASDDCYGDKNCDGYYTPCYTDNDGDGYYAESDDCNDSDASVNPGGTDDCYTDRNCDGYIEPCYTDNDGDGYYAEQDDCDDNDANTHPGAAEICDGKDNDCDGNIGEDPILITFVRTHANCRATSTGAIDISVSGGTAPFTYTWNTGAVTEDLVAIPVGGYRVTVTSAVGCTKKSIYLGIGQPGNIGLTATVTQTGVNPARYKVVATGSGGVTPQTYTYRMRPVGGTWTVWQSQKIFVNRTVGTYQLQIKTAGAPNCNIYKTITINVPSNNALMADAPDADLVIEDAAEMMEIAEMEDSPTKLEVFPNPTSETLNIRLLDDTDTESNIVIYDFLGRMVYQHAIMDNTNGNLMTVQLPSSLPSGTYLVVCPMADGTRVTQHFVLAKN